MEKSVIYKFAQCAVLDSKLDNYTKLEIVRELMEKEDTALWVEKEKEKKKNEAV